MKRKRRGNKKRGKIILIVGMVFLIAVLGTALFLTLQKNKKVAPEQLLADYTEKIIQGDYDGMYDMISLESQERISREDFVERNQKIYEGIEASDIRLEQKEPEEQNGKIVIPYKFSMETLAGSVSFSWKAVFVEEEERYALNWTHTMIFPDLGEKDKVSIKKEAPKRGNIYDRNGLMLAGEGTASSVGLVPGRMQEDPSQDLERMAELLGTTAENIQKKLEASWVKDDSFVPIKTLEKVNEMAINQGNATEKEQQLAALQEQLLQIDGVMITDTQVRQYPLKEAASHLIGYVQSITAEELEEHAGEGYSSTSVIGKAGLEKLYEEQLRGTTGWRISIVTESGEEKEIIASRPCIDGEDIYLTIDANLQRKIYQEFGEDKSTSVAMNPKTGEVLALLSMPGYDNNLFIRGMSQSEWDELSNDENTPMQNRFKAVWCPGSSMKPITAAIGLNTGTLSETEELGESSLSWQKDESWGDYRVTTIHAAPSPVMEEAIIYSDNVYFAKAALQIGQDNFAEQLKKLGFGEELTFDFGLSASQYSNSDGFDSEIQLADSGYGQGQMLVNPVHLASIYSAFYNDGNMIAPYLLREADGHPTWWKENVFTSETAQKIEQMLIQVVESPNGTGHGATIEGLTLAGKTGTAELKTSKEDTEGTELGWFCVYTVDAEEPILMVTMVEDVKQRGGSGYVVDKIRNVLLN